MKLKYWIILIVELAAFVVGIVFVEQNTQKMNTTSSALSSAVPASVAVNSDPKNINEPVIVISNDPVVTLASVLLKVPYISEAPDNNWTGPWKNACEEASMTMVDKFYNGQSSVSIADAKKEMTMFFDVQNKLWGSNANADTARAAKLINDNTIYNALIVAKPTIDQIKNELAQGRPVIAPLYGFDLHNKNIPFVPLPRGTSYHMLVIIGYDDATKEFITNDDGDTKQGANHRYSYDVLMNALHDYSFVTKHADGPARVIFTYPKLVKLAGSPKVYYLHDQVKQYIPSESIFKAKGWSWTAVNVVAKDWLDTFTAGTDLN